MALITHTMQKKINKYITVMTVTGRDLQAEKHDEILKERLIRLVCHLL